MDDPHEIQTVKKERDSYWTLYMRYTFLYWFLAFCATGSAISTAIKAAYNSRAEPPAQAANAAPGDAKLQRYGQPLDGWILVLTVSTVVATALQSTIHPDQLADRYRFGQLVIEKALTRYDAIIGEKTQADVDAVIGAYDKAQDFLQGGITQLASKIS